MPTESLFPTTKTSAKYCSCGKSHFGEVKAISRGQGGLIYMLYCLFEYEQSQAHKQTYTTYPPVYDCPEVLLCTVKAVNIDAIETKVHFWQDSHVDKNS